MLSKETQMKHYAAKNHVPVRTDLWDPEVNPYFKKEPRLLQAAIPGELYEAAKVDGANAWSRYIRITLPLLRRTFALVLIIQMIVSFLAFEQFYIMTSSGPRQKTITVVYKIFVEAFQSFEMGDAAALSMVLLVILLFFSYLQLRLLRDDTRL